MGFFGCTTNKIINTVYTYNFFFFFVFQNKKLIIHLLDDFHVINVHGHPTDRASSAIHMASSLLDIQPTAAAVPRPNNTTCIHSTTFVRKNGQDVLCRGGIVKTFVISEMTDLLKNYHQTYLQTLPVEFHHIKPERVQQQLQELRWATCNLINLIQKHRHNTLRTNIMF